ncbi:MAG: type III secretion system export apparatus subunit SctR [Deltaproteobacteria bacterium]|nr:type III secretion system export apparatus subunit SctR [Deltaproteobacteria bacterium]
MKKILFFCLFVFVLLLSFAVFAQATTTTIDDQPISKPILVLFVLFIMSLAPFVLMMTTSFVKIAVVLSLIRSALGVQQIPPNQVVTGLALILTVYVMIPVGQQVYNATSEVIHAQTQQDILTLASISILKEAVDKGKEPVREFLLKHSNDKERKLFYTQGKKLKINQTLDDLTSKDFIVLIPAFVVSELSEAFQIGFILFLPFLVIDMVISSILLSMGMFQLSPITVSLPFKLLLFILVDGWYLITEGLVKGYILP